MPRRRLTGYPTDLRFAALQRWLDEHETSRRWLARQLERTHSCVQYWFEIQQWPERETERIERVLKVPPGFFSRIQAGQPYEKALVLPIPKAVPIPVKPQAVSQLEQIFRRNREEQAGPYTVAEILDHLERQIEMFFRVAMPDNQVTVEGVQRAKQLVEQHGITPLRKSGKKRAAETIILAVSSALTQ